MANVSGSCQTSRVLLFMWGFATDGQQCKVAETRHHPPSDRNLPVQRLEHIALTNFGPDKIASNLYV
ncbi:MAG: hypothetical protein DWI22_11340 [Planctomycetota bacterium]|nr:MAG: hypothetical protein DWI22_11340 [Planctomycetota bacterium]